MQLLCVRKLFQVSLGLVVILDPEKNVFGVTGDISTDAATLRVLVIPTDEELVIARDVGAFEKIMIRKSTFSKERSIFFMLLRNVYHLVRETSPLLSQIFSPVANSICS